MVAREDLYRASQRKEANKTSTMEKEQILVGLYG
jgi:hypothetical protein